MERHPYGPDRSQFGELSLPPGDPPSRLAVLLHGGFWRARYGCELMHGLAADLLARGWATWNLEFRRLGNGGGYPMTFDDVAAGIEHAATLVPGLGLPPVAIGHSAGGHLAAWAATRVPLGGVVAQAGVLDLRRVHKSRLDDGTVAELLGAAPKERPERYAYASPAERLPLGVPLLLTHGARDEVVSVRLSQRFAAAGRRAGDRVALHVEPGEGHMGHLDPVNPLWLAAVRWLERGK